MNTACRVSQEEFRNDISSMRHSPQQLIVRSEIRMEVIDAADRIIRGDKTVQVFRYGARYTRDQAMIDFVEHDLCDSVIFKAWEKDRMPLTDLLTRIVQRVVAESWYGEITADDLGFSK